MLINLSFLKTHRDYRYLFLGQTHLRRRQHDDLHRPAISDV